MGRPSDATLMDSLRLKAGMQFVDSGRLTFPSSLLLPSLEVVVMVAVTEEEEE